MKQNNDNAPKAYLLGDHPLITNVAILTEDSQGGAVQPIPLASTDTSLSSDDPGHDKDRNNAIPSR